MKSFRASAFFLLAVFASIAAQAADFKVLLDLDNQPSTGCSVITGAGTFSGVEAVLTTTVEPVGGVQRVTGVSRQQCVNGTFAAPIPVDSTGWAVGTDANGKMVVETGVPFSELSPNPIESVHVAFVASSGGLTDVILSRTDSSPILFPDQMGRRRSGPGTTRTIALDGDLSDWGMIAPLVDGNASTGSSNFRFTDIYGYAGNTHLYFAFELRNNRNAPTAVDDSFFVLIGHALNVAAPGILGNDISPNGAPLSAILVSGPQHGALTLNPNGSFVYLHDGSNAPLDSFRYKVTNGTVESNAAQVRIDITTNSAPNALPDTGYTVAHRGTLTVPAKGVLANDSDPDGDTLHAQLATNPLHGTVTLNADGSFTYTHDGSNTLTDSFTYRAADSSSTSNIATVTITISPDIPPVAVGEGYTLLEGATLNVAAPGLFANDTDVDTPQTFWSATVVTPPAHGNLTMLPGGGFTYVNDSVTGASDSFTYRVNDGIANGNIVTVALTVTPVNDMPTLAIGGPVTILDTDGPQSIPFVSSSNGGASDELGQVINYIVTNDNNALFSVQPSVDAAGVLHFTPIVGVSGVANITVRAHDNGGVANGGVDTSGPQTSAANVDKIPAITSGNTTTFLVGQAGTFSVTTNGQPKPSIAEVGALPAGVTFVDGTGPNKGTGVLSGTPAANTGGSYPITFQATNPHGSSPIQNFTLIVNQPPVITSAANATFTRNQAGTFTITTTGFPVAALTETGALPTGLSFLDNANGTATLSGTPTAVGGIYSITVNANNGVGGTVQQTLTITINEVPAITSGNATNFQAGTPATFGVTTTGFPAPALGETGALPAGITFVDNGNGTATLGGSAANGSGGVYAITITATNVAGNAPQSFTITVCNNIVVTAPGVTSATAGSAFSQTFTQTGAVGGATFTTASTLPTGMTLATNGTLSGTPTQTGSFPIVVTVTDGNGCTGTSGTYTLVVGCQTISVTNPGVNSGVAGAAFSQIFTQTGAIGGATFTTVSTLPTGMTLATNGTLSGTPTQTGSFPIVVTATDGNGCTGSGATYTLTIACQTITVTNPGVNSGVAAAAFSQTFTQTGSIGGATFTTSSTLPAGLALSTGGVLSGTPTQTGSFPIVVTVTDGNGCTGTGATYTLTITCQTINVTNPGVTSGTASTAFTQTFTQTGAIGTATFTTSSTLPAGLTLSTAGVLSGTPTQTGSFPIVVTVTDANGCTGTGATYTLVIGCQTITVTNPGVTTGTVSAAFSQIFTQSGAIGTATFTTASALPSGLTLASNGTLAGVPTQTGSFPIVVTVTDSNGCTGSGATYTLVIACQTITVTNPSTSTGPAGTPYSGTFTQTGAIGTATFTTASTLPTGLTLSTSGVLSGTPSQGGTFPIVVTVTDSNGCTGSGATFTLIITCPTITVTNPGVNTGTAGVAFSQTFTQTGAVGTATFTTASTLPTGITLSTAGLLSGTTTQVGTFPIVVTVTDSNGCTGTGTTYNLTIGCQTVSVTNPGVNTGTVDAAFTQTFTVTGILGSVTWSETGALPAGITLNSSTGVLSGTPTVTGSFPITVKATDTNGCFGTSSYTLTINCQTITVTNPGVNSGTVGAPFSQTFTQTAAHGTATFTTASTLPGGITLSAAGLLSGTPTQLGSFPIVVTVTDSNGCTGTGATYTLTINCQTISVTNPGVTTGTASTAFTQTFTQTGAIGTATFTTASTLPTGLTLSAAGVLSGTPTQTGSFPIVVTVTDSNGCTGTGATYTLVIGCQTITVTNPGVTTGTVSAAFSQIFTQSGAIGTATFTTASALPSGLTLASNGTLSGVPTQSGTFPIVVTVTDSNGCTGTGATYTLVIACQTITVTNPLNATDPAGTPFSATFTQTGAVGTATFTTASTLPTGLTLSTAGVLSGTPSQGGTFPIVVTVTDSNGCTGSGATYNLIITCPTITVTNPGVNTGTAGVAFSQTFTQTGAVGSATFTTASTLPTGITLSTAGVLSGTTTQVGTFPIVVTVTDSNGCTGTGASYNLTIGCQTVSVTNPGVNTGTVDAAFTQTFTVTGILGSVTWSETGALPAGITLNSSTGVLSGTPTVTGSFPITVKATDTNGCFGTSSYTLTINCQTITVTNPGVNTGTVAAPFSQTFTQTAAHGTATFTTASTLPAGITLSAAGLLSGTPTQTGSFPIVVTVTDSNGCTGTGATYTLTIGCQTITVTNPAGNTGTVNAAFSATFTQTGAQGSATFTTASTLPTGITLAANGVLSGTTLQHGTFPIVVTVTDANGCTGTGATYNLTINCQTITVTNPATTTGTVAAAFSQTFTQVGAIGGATFTTASTLPTGITLATNGTLSGTPTQSGSFPIVVTVTDGGGCTGTGATYTLVIGCNVISVTNPVNNLGTAGSAFSETFTQAGGNGTITWSKTGALPAGITLNTSTGVLSGVTTVTGTFPITVTATDGNGCVGTGATYNLTINCQTITVTNPGVNTVQAGVAFDQTFTAAGILGTATWSKSGALPAGITLNTTTGHLAGTTTAIGSYPITVTATDTNGCTGTGATYTLTVTCPTITVTRTGGGSFPAAVFNTAYAGQSVTASGGGGSYTFAVTAGTFPTGLSLAAGGAISGTPTATGTFNFTVTATDTVSLCTGTQSFSIAVNPSAGGDSYSNLVNNTQAVVTGGTTTSPATPFVGLTGTIISNDLPAGGVAAVAGTFATTQGGSVTIAVDGTFIYTPPVTATALASDTFTYTAASDTGATGTPATSTGTVTLNLAGRVWYVKNNGAAGNGQSQSPFNSLGNFTNGARATPDKPSDIIYVYNGDGTTTNHNAGVSLLASEQLIGEGVALIVNGNTLVASGTKPQISNAAGSAVVLAAGNTVKGLTVTGPSANGIIGTGVAGFTGDTLTLQGAGAGSSALALVTVTGTVTLTNTTISNSPTGVTINGGTATVTIDNTNTINSSAGQRTVSILNRGAGANNITIGAAINDSGTGISVTNNTVGTFNFTGTQTMATTTNPAVTLTTNSGATISFSGLLGITTTTGSGFVASGGGTLNVGTATISTGAAANALSLNGMTIGAVVTFSSVSSTGATTAIALTNVTGLVTVNGGTLTNGTTGISLQGPSTSLTLANVTITGPATGITNTANFGTLTIGSSVSVSAATALNLTTGAISGTFANVTSSGGTNGVNLNAVTGTWGATAGTLTGASGATFNVTGGSGGTISWGGAITQASAATAVTIAGGNSNTINFSGNVTSSGNGISIGASSGTYNFAGTTNALTGAGGIAITSATGSISFNAGTSINVTSTSFAVTTSSANITYSGTITQNNNGTKVFAIDTYSVGTLTMNGTSLSGTVAVGAGGVTSTLNNITGSVAINNLSLTSSDNTFAGTLVAITGTNTAGSMTFNHLTLSAIGSNHTGKGLTAVGGGTITITATGGASSIDVGSTALDLNGVALGASTIATLNSLGVATQNGVLFTNVTGGTLTITGGAITGNTASAFKVSGGTASISYGGTITQNTAAQRAIDVVGATGGTLTFSGAIGSTGGTGVFLNNNSGATINISGAMTLSTAAAAAFTATGGGVVNVTNAGNSITTSSGAGITFNGVTGTSTETFSTVTATTSGAAVTTVSTGATNFTFGTISSQTGTAVSITTSTGDFVFTKISSNGAAKGIAVSALTGGGSFTVNGTGGLCDGTHISGTDCTGGSILGGTTRGAEFNNAASVTLNNMYFKGNGTTAVACGDDVSGSSNTACSANLYLVTASNPTLTKIYVDGTGSGDSGIIGNAVSGMTVSGLEIANFTNTAKTAMNFQNLTGTVGITGLNVHNNNVLHNVMVTNNTGTATITFTSPIIQNAGGAGNPDGLQVNSYTAGTVLNVTSNSGTFNNVPGNGVMFQANSGSNMTGVLSGGTATLTNGLLMQETGTGTAFNFTVTGLTAVTTHNLGSNAITVGKGNGTGTFTGTVTNNVITSATCGGGCAGIKVASFGVSGSSTVNVTNNNISGVDAQAIWVVGGQGASSLTATVQNNNIHNPVAGNTSYAIDVYPGTTSGDAVCFAINLGDMTAAHSVSGNRNTITGSWQSGGNPIEVGIFNNSIFKLLNYPSPNTNDTNAANWVAASNGAIGTDAFHLGTNQFTAGPSCP